jgi:hypothetical protein
MTSIEEMEEETRVALREDVAVAELVPNSGALAPIAGTVQVDTFYGAGDLNLTKEQQDKLSAPINPEDIDILPTGEIYYAHDQYRRRLNEAIGIGQWSLRPIDGWQRMGNTVCREFALMINGKFAATGLGEADYYENNSRSSWATACESAKSIALRRACKEVGIALECWNRRYAEAWKRQYAHQSGGKWYRNDTGAGSAPVDGRGSESSDARKVPSDQSSSPTPVHGPAPVGSTAVIRPVKFGKQWKRGTVECAFVTDTEQRQWTVAGGVNIAAVQAALNAGCDVRVTFKTDGKWLNVSKVEEVTKPE